MIAMRLNRRPFGGGASEAGGHVVQTRASSGDQEEATAGVARRRGQGSFEKEPPMRMLVVVGILAVAACTNTSRKENRAPATTAPAVLPPTAALPAAAAKEAKPSRSPAQATCDKYKDAVAQTLAIEITRVVAQDIPGAPLQCVYQNAKLPVAIKFRPGGNLQASRKEMSTDGAHAFDSPALGKNGFRANFGGV